MRKAGSRIPKETLITVANLLCYVRLGAIPALLVLAALDLRREYVWLLAFAWATDSVDGWLARRLGEESRYGARLDSTADLGLTATIPLGVTWLFPDMLQREAVWVGMLLAALVVPRGYALYKFHRLPSYHTWLAKSLAVFMAFAVLLLIRWDWPWPFRVGAMMLLVEAAEEIAITHELDRWRADVASLWHLRRERG